MQDRRIALVTGAGSGIGLATAVELARKGFEVWGTMRDPAKSESLVKAVEQAGLGARLRVERLDVTDAASIDDVAAKIHAQVPSLAVLVNNAGFGLAGFVEDVALDELKRQFETNFFGAVRTATAFLPKMRAQGSGRIVNVSSGWGRLGAPGASSYAASKHALEGWSESLHYEVRRHGVRVVLVEPGAFKTDIWTNQQFAARARDQQSFYFERFKRFDERSSEYVKNLKSDPSVVARVIARAATKRRPRLRYPVGFDARTGLFLRRVLPACVYHWAFEKVLDNMLG
jgi:NAD(P)-dependent dehydrogenase (short-subunit alcohol dehydrogenase family)